MEQKDIQFRVILHERKDCAQTGEYACQNVDMETHHGRVKDAVDKMCSDVIRRSMLLVTTSPDNTLGCGADRAHIAPLVQVSRAPHWAQRRGWPFPWTGPSADTWTSKAEDSNTVWMLCR